MSKNRSFRPNRALTGLIAVAIAVAIAGTAIAAIGGRTGERDLGGTCFGKPATITGTAGADTISGTGDDDVILGLGGNDTISGAGAGDAICGGGGDDEVSGEGGRDLVNGGRGEDTASGGSGADRIKGRSGDDTLAGNAGNDRLGGGPGTDDCDGGTGNNRTRACETPQGDGGDGGNGGNGGGEDPKQRDPKAGDDADSTDEATAKAVDVLANDTDADGDTLKVQSLGTGSTQGKVTITGGGSGANYDPDGQFESLGAGATGTDTFTYVVKDGNGGTDSATATITINGIDDPPVALADSKTLAEDDPATAVDVLANDTDVDGGAKSIGSKFDGAHGAVAITGGGSGLTYLPDPDFCGSDSFTYTLNGGSSTTVAITVTCVDDTANAVDDSQTVAEDSGATTIDVRQNDTDPDPSPDLITAKTDGAHGTVAITNGGADLTYTPDANFCSPPADTFTYTLAGGSTATVTVTVTCVDDGPAAVDDSPTVAEDSGATTIDVRANDTDIDGGPKTITAKTNGAHGTVAITNGGDDLNYTPENDYCGADSFTYTLNGGSTATVSVTVTCVEDAADAVDDVATVNEDSGANTIDVRANDTDPDATKDLVTAKSDGAHGAVAITNGGADLSYTPDANYCGADSFTYTVAGGDTATVSVTITCVEDAADAVDDAATVDEDSGANTIDVRANDTDPDATKDLVTAKSDGANGAVAITNGGADLSYTPDANYCGPDTFTYTLAGGDTANVAVTVTCVDDDPVAVNDAATVDEDSGANTIDVRVNDTDIDGGPKTVISKTNGSNGATVTITNGGDDLTYEPALNYCGADSFTYTLNGGSTATVSVTVTCQNDAPAIDLDTGAGGTGSTSTFNETDPHTGTGVLIAPNAQITDVDDTNIESATVTLTNRPDGDSFESLAATIPGGSPISGGSYDTGTGVITFTGSATKAQYEAVLQSIRYDNTKNPPNPADRTINVIANDGDLDSATSVATVDVVPINAAPVVDLDSTSGSDDSSASFTEGGGPVDLAPNATVSDADAGDTIESAEIKITNLQDGAAESLAVTIPGGSPISIAGGSYNSATGVLGLTGSATPAQYEAVLESATYDNSSDTPGTTARAVTFKVNDGQDDSVARTSTVSMTPANDAPIVDLNGTGTGGVDTNASFTEDGGAITLAGSTAVADVDNTNLASATVTLTNRPDGAAESLSVDVTGTSISATAYVPATGVLALSGSDTLANYQQVLRTVGYDNSSQDPTATDRGVTFKVNDGSDDSATATATTTVTVVNDAPVLTQPDGALTYTEDTPSENHQAAIAPNLTAVDVDTDVTSATVEITGNYQNGQDVLSFTNTAQITGSFNAASGRMTLTGNTTPANYQAALRDVRYSNTSDAPNTSTRTISFQADDGEAANHASNTVTRSVDVVATNDAPVADNESLTVAANNNAVGNTPLAVGTTVSEPKKSIAKSGATDVLTGDSDVDGPGPLQVVAATVATADGGSVTIAANGDFTYTPAANDAGCADTSDSFDYTVTDQFPGTPGTDTGTVTIEVANCVWYLDSAVAGPGTGTAGDPFKALSGVNGAGGTGDADGASDTIMFLDAASYSGGLPLENNQLLRSERAGLTVGGSTIVTASGASNPTITNASGNALTLASGNTIQGIDLGSTNAGSASLAGSAVGTATINTSTSGSIANASGGAVDVSNGTLNASFTDVDSTGATNDAIRLDNLAGSFTAGSGSSLQNAGGQDVDISGNNSGDTIDFTYDGTISDSSGTVVSVANQNGGTKDFNGTIGTSGSPAGAISLASNTGATVRFDGGTILSTGASNAFSATGGGTVAVTDPTALGTEPDNRLTTTTGTALNVANTTIGANDLNFRSISSNGAASGIILNSTGSSGGLTVSGNGGTCSSAANCTGGAIESSSGPGISLTSVNGGVDLTRVAVIGGSDDGIRGSTVVGLNLANSVVLNNGNAVGERGIDMLGLTGSAGLASSTVSGSGETNVRVENDSGSLSAFNVTGSTISQATVVNGDTKDDGILMLGTGSGSMNVSVTGSTFTDNKGDHFQAATDADASLAMDVTFTGNTLSTTAGNDPNVLGGGITINSSGTADLTVDVSANNIQQAFDDAINFNLDPGSQTGSSLTATVSGNTIGSAGSTDSGSESSNAITVGSKGEGTGVVAIENNTIRQWANAYGIFVQLAETDNDADGARGGLDATITSNNLENPGTFALNGLRVEAGATAADAGPTLCAGMTNNDVTGTGFGGGTDIRVNQRFGTTIKLPGYVGTTTDNAAVNAFVQNNNDPTGTPTVSATQNVAGGGGGFVGGASCLTPP